MRTWEQPEIDVLEEIEEDLDTSLQRELIVFNDDENTFDFVIDTLIKVCGHSPEQAEQCTLIIHYKGKCSVKLGSFNDLKPMRDAITDRGIGAMIL
jgi:ATP-dependent Clp protease adaptor protein ClpS